MFVCLCICWEIYVAPSPNDMRLLSNVLFLIYQNGEEQLLLQKNSSLELERMDLIELLNKRNAEVDRLTGSTLLIPSSSYSSSSSSRIPTPPHIPPVPTPCIPAILPRIPPVATPPHIPPIPTPCIPPILPRISPVPTPPLIPPPPVLFFVLSVSFFSLSSSSWLLSCLVDCLNLPFILASSCLPEESIVSSSAVFSLLVLWSSLRSSLFFLICRHRLTSAFGLTSVQMQLI